MKRTLIFALALVITLLSCVAVSATETETEMAGNTYVVDGVTVVFEASSTLTVEEQQFVAEYLVHGGESGETYGLICSLLGHKYLREAATAVTHCVKELSPRCREDTYEIDTCERCGHVEAELISSSYVVCCK